MNMKMTAVAATVALTFGWSSASAEEILNCTWKTGAVEANRVGGETWQYWDATEKGWFDVPCQLFNQAANISCGDVSDETTYRYHTVLSDVARDDAGQVEHEHFGQAIMTIDRETGQANSNAGIESKWRDPAKTESHHFDNHGICVAIPDPALDIQSAL